MAKVLVAGNEFCCRVVDAGAFGYFLQNMYVIIIAKTVALAVN